MLFLHTNYLAVYYSLYKVNTAGLTASCCEKKVENCNAHCYLDKKMNEENNNDKRSASSEMKLKITEYIVEDYIPVLNSDETFSYYSNDRFIKIKGYLSEIDHPPQS